MPSRLLRIDGTASSTGTSTAQAASGTVTLVETAAAAAVPYVALSYCWGPYTADIRTTVAANLREHMHGIAVAALPRTVQDAILVAARLGVSYIWVDALCIVQDDAADCKLARAYNHMGVATHLWEIYRVKSPGINANGRA